MVWACEVVNDTCMIRAHRHARQPFRDGSNYVAHYGGHSTYSAKLYSSIISSDHEYGEESVKKLVHSLVKI